MECFWRASPSKILRFARGEVESLGDVAIASERGEIMKRKDAFRKLRTICERLDERDPEQFPVIPVRLYLFGSVLTDKPDPVDVDLLFEYQNHPDVDSTDLVNRLSYGKPLPHEQAMKQLRRGMQMIRIGVLIDNVEEWVDERFFEPDMPVKLVWEQGLDWRSIVDEFEAHPVAAWDPDKDAEYKEEKEIFQQIVEETGSSAAWEWLKRRKQGGQDEGSEWVDILEYNAPDPEVEE